MGNTSGSISENHSIHTSQDCMVWAQMQLLTEVSHSHYLYMIINQFNLNKNKNIKRRYIIRNLDLILSI